MGYKVLAVDMDPQGNLTMSLGLDPDSVRPSMYDVLVNGVNIEEALHPARARRRGVEHRPGGGGDRAQLADRPGAGAQQGPDAGAATATTTSSSTRRPPWGCSPSTRSPRPTRSSSPCNASIFLCVAWPSSRRPSNWCGTTSIPRVHIAGIVPTMYDSRTVHGREAVEVLRQQLRRPGVQHAHPQDHQVRGSAGQGGVGAQVRSGQPGSQRISAARERGAQWKKDLA